MSLLDLLAQVAGNANGPSDHHFDQIAQQASPDLLGQGLSEAFRSDQTPPFGQMVGQLFGQSNGGQQAGLLNSILAAVGPAVLAGVAGGTLGKLLQPGASQLTPEQASRPTSGRGDGSRAGQANRATPAALAHIDRL